MELAAHYDQEGADELVFLDISASQEGRRALLDVVERTTAAAFIPCTVGGGIRTLADIRALLNAGADKVSINTAALEDPELVRGAAARFGSQCIVVAIDARRRAGEPSSWEVYAYGGTRPTGRDAVEWAREAERLGAGEILLTSMDKDGTQAGYDLALTRAVAQAVNIPVIASGGAGTLADIGRVVSEGRADAVLAASIFHYGRYRVVDVKDYLRRQGVAVRWPVTK